MVLIFQFYHRGCYLKPGNEVGSHLLDLFVDPPGKGSHQQNLMGEHMEYQ